MSKNEINIASQAQGALAIQLEKIYSIDDKSILQQNLEQLFLQWNTTQWADDPKERARFQLLIYTLRELLAILPDKPQDFYDLTYKMKGNE